MRPAFGAFAASGTWFRGNCHTHTAVGDGDTSPEEIVRRYRRRGYHFVVLTDHERCYGKVRELQRDGFLVIDGIEVHPPTGAPALIADPALGHAVHHIVGIGVDRAPKPTHLRSAEAAIRWINGQGGIAVYAHPYWSGHTIEHLREGRAALGMEVFNAATEAVHGLGEAGVHLDQALSGGLRWKVFAVDDMHRMKRDAFGGWIMVKAARLTKAAIMGAIRAGHFYATTGPEIKSLRLERGVVHLKCSPVRKVVWHCEGPVGRRIVSAGGMTEAAFEIRRSAPCSKYLRVEIVDAAGRKAWSNPVWRRRTATAWSD